jgi:hypothetical protein
MVKTVAVFKVGGNDSFLKSNVRSAAPVSTSFKGAERRTVKPLPAKPKKSPAQLARQPIALPTEKVASGGNAGADEWETF